MKGKGGNGVYVAAMAPHRNKTNNAGRKGENWAFNYTPRPRQYASCSKYPAPSAYNHSYVCESKEYLNGSAYQYRRGYASMNGTYTKILSGAVEGLAMSYLILVSLPFHISRLMYFDWTSGRDVAESSAVTGKE